jgi:pantetheine-phosphate adenylyltransferase
LDVVRRAQRLFGAVVVAVGRNAAKDGLLSLDERVALARASCAGLEGVTVEPLPGLLVDFCRAHGVAVVVKGARGGGDFEFELAMAQMNASLAGVETVVLPAAPALGFVSSTLVRQIARGGADVKEYIPTAVFDYLRRTGHASAGEPN